MIKRKLKIAIQNHLSQKEMILIVGPRQAGKTTLMKKIENELKAKGEKTVFLNLDIEHDRPFFESQEKLLQKIKLEMGTNHGFVFIDEIQRKQDAGLFLKGIYDQNIPYKFIVSGSGSLELKEKIHESLVGRKRLFELSTVSFEEFVDFKTDYKYENNQKEFLRLETGKRKKLLDEYLSFGGYPRVITSETIEEKRLIMDEIYRSYLERDLAYLLNIRKTDHLSRLVKVLADQAGGLVKFSELSATLGISFQTVKHYLWILEKTFILHRVTPYFSNMRKEITKTPIFYFHDLGFLNYAQGTFGQTEIGSRAGQRFENFIFNTLRIQLAGTSGDIHFWRTKSQAEVDFIVEKGGNLIPIEVKHQSFTKKSVPKSLKHFLKTYTPKTAFLINLDQNDEKIIGESAVHTLPFFEMKI